MTLPRPLLAALLLAVPALGCNSLTGADGLVIDDDFDSDGRPPKSKGGDPSGGATSGDATAATSGGAGGGASGVTSSGVGAGSTSGDPTTGTGEPDPLGDAAGVSIQSIALYQSMKRPLMENGAAAQSSIPIVAGKDALVRVFVSTNGYDGSPVIARLYLNGSPQPIEVSKTLSGNSSEGNLGSTINFEVPGGELTGSFGYRVELKQQLAGGANPGARYPASGDANATASSSGTSLKVMLIPVAYGADGSNRLPDTSAAQLKRYADMFYAMYPTPQVDIQVHGSVGWNSQVSSGGGGWDSLLNAMADLRENENAPNDVYYYGIFSPASSINNYCGGGCVAGLGFVGGPADSYTRVAIGLGFPGEGSVETAVHEIGHTHGRNHAPCGGAAGTDGSFPYGDGSIGVWGYDPINKQLKSPNDTADMMSYCNPIWLSDYTYKALFTRLKTVNNASLEVDPAMMNRTWDRLRVDADRELSWMEPIKLRMPPMGEAKSVALATDLGTEDIQGHYYAYDHVEGGVLLWPQSAQQLQEVAVVIAGKTKSLSR